MRLYLDDVRNPNRLYGDNYFVWVKTYKEAIQLLKTGQVESISLDHDLGYTDPNHTGYDVACWIEAAVRNSEIPLPEMYCHSWNPVGKDKILATIQSLENWKVKQT